MEYELKPYSLVNLLHLPNKVKVSNNEVDLEYNPQCRID